MTTGWASRSGPSFPAGRTPPFRSPQNSRPFHPWPIPSIPTPSSKACINPQGQVQPLFKLRATVARLGGPNHSPSHDQRQKSIPVFQYAQQVRPAPSFSKLSSPKVAPGNGLSLPFQVLIDDAFACVTFFGRRSRKARQRQSTPFGIPTCTTTSPQGLAQPVGRSRLRLFLLKLEVGRLYRVHLGPTLLTRPSSPPDRRRTTPSA